MDYFYKIRHPLAVGRCSSPLGLEPVQERERESERERDREREREQGMDTLY
jgi:hypothetical protein